MTGQKLDGRGFASTSYLVTPHGLGAAGAQDLLSGGESTDSGDADQSAVGVLEMADYESIW